MKKIRMPTLTTKLRRLGGLRAPKTLTITGGWTLRIPEVTALDEDTTKLYGRFFRSQGMEGLAADAEVLKRMNEIFAAGWYRHLTTSVRYWARKYATKYPKNINEDGTLAGFEPEKLQNAYIPKVNVGKKGKLYVKTLFAEMNENGRGV